MRPETVVIGLFGTAESSYAFLAAFIAIIFKFINKNHQK